MHVTPTWSSIGDVPILLIAAAFFLVDFAIDKLSEVRRGLRGGIVISAALGAILFDAHAGPGLSWVAAVALGGGTAAALHGARAFARPAVATADGDGSRVGATARDGLDPVAGTTRGAGTDDGGTVHAMDVAPSAEVPRIARLDRAVPGLSGATMSLLEDLAAALLVIVAFSAPAIAGAVTIVLLLAAATAAVHVGRIRRGAPRSERRG